MATERREQLNIRLNPTTEALWVHVGRVLSGKIGLDLSPSDLFRLGLLALADKHGIDVSRQIGRDKSKLAQ